MSYSNFENFSSNSLLTISNLSNFSITTRNQYKEYIKQVKKKRKAKISILESYLIEDFIRISQINVNFDSIVNNNSRKFKSKRNTNLESSKLFLYSSSISSSTTSRLKLNRNSTIKEILIIDLIDNNSSLNN